MEFEQDADTAVKDEYDIVEKEDEDIGEGAQILQEDHEQIEEKYDVGQVFRDQMQDERKYTISDQKKHIENQQIEYKPDSITMDFDDDLYEGLCSKVL